MTNKELFIKAVQCMADFEKIFIASPEFWGAMYDRIHMGERVDDRIFVSIYKTIDVIQQIKNNPIALRAEEDNRNRRMLLDALDHRLSGQNVIIISCSSSESGYMQREFFSLVDDVVGSASLSAEQLESFNRGQLEFKVANESTMRDICLTHQGVGLLGFMKGHRVFLTQETIKDRFINKNDPFVALLNKYGSDKPVSDFIKKAEVTLKNLAQQRHREQKAILDMALSSPSQHSWVIYGVDRT